MQTQDLAGQRVGNAEIKNASRAAMASLLNLTFLPGIAFVWLLLRLKKSAPDSIEHYHIMFGVKLNVVAFIVLFFVSGVMIVTGGFHSPWTWVYVITYFTFVHTVFILIAVWALVRAWAGQKVRTKA